MTQQDSAPPTELPADTTVPPGNTEPAPGTAADARAAQFGEERLADEPRHQQQGQGGE